MSYRKMVQQPKVKVVTQGSIFNFAQADSGSALGMVISARCDLAQFKQERFLYVPLINAPDWIDSILVPKMIEETKKGLVSDLGGILKKNGHSANAVVTFGPSKAAHLIKGTKDEKTYLEKLGKINIIEKQTAESIYDKSLLTSKSLLSKVSDIMANKVEGYFFIDEVIDFHDANKSLGSYIVDLSDPRPLHRIAASLISEGLLHDDIDSSSRVYDAVYNTPGEISYILCDVSSPYVELILQRFAYFYSRIGVENPSIELKENLVAGSLQ